MGAHDENFAETELSPSHGKDERQQNNRTGVLRLGPTPALF
jgi:hypothetical protein